MGKKNNIAMIVSSFVEYSQTFIYDEVVNHQNYNIDIFTKERKNSKHFPYNFVTSMLPSKSLKDKLSAIIYNLTFHSKKFENALNKKEYSLIHSHFGTHAIYALPLVKKSGLPLIVTFHGYDVPLLMTSKRFKPKYWGYWLKSKKLFKNISRFLAASTELKELLIQLGAPQEKVKIWRLGVDIPKLIPTKKSGKEVLMIGRFVEKKGFEYGIEAIAQAIKKGVDCHLSIIGGGKLKNNYLDIIKKNGIEENVTFTGILSHEEVLDKLLSIDILIAPSVVSKDGNRESGLIVAKEAAARAVPVIGTMHGGIPEIIDNAKTGYLVEERNSQQITDKLILLLNDSQLRKSLGLAARKKMENEYDIKKRVLELERHYAEVTKEFSPKNP